MQAPTTVAANTYNLPPPPTTTFGKTEPIPTNIAPTNVQNTRVQSYPHAGTGPTNNSTVASQQYYGIPGITFNSPVQFPPPPTTSFGAQLTMPPVIPPPTQSVGSSFMQWMNTPSEQRGPTREPGATNPHLFPPVYYNPVTLLPKQVPWFNRAQEILKQQMFVIDSSPTGEGKTFIAMKLAQTYKIPILVICPATAKTQIWQRFPQMYGIMCYDTLSFAAVRGDKRRTVLSHGWLTRHDTLRPDGKTVTTFAPTQKFVDFVAMGGILIVDEFHHAKNSGSGQTKAVAAMVKYIIDQKYNNCGSRVMLLSGTALDKEEHVTPLLKTLGVIKHDKLFSSSRTTKQLSLQGIGDLIKVCMDFNQDLTHSVLAGESQEKENMHRLVFKLYTEVLSKYVSGGITKETNTEFRNDAANGFFKISEQCIKDLHEAVAALRAATRYNPITGETEFNQQNMGTIQQAQRAVEIAKAYDMARVALLYLNSNPNLKIIISVSYLETIDRLHGYLAFYNPSILKGDVRGKKRDSVIDNFNRPDTMSRILIMMTVVGGESINLHDTDGRFPRIMLISPSYMATSIVQCIGRCDRTGMKSNVITRLFYGQNENEEEKKILESLMTKTKVIEKMMTEENQRNIIMVCNYPPMIEV